MITNNSIKTVLLALGLNIKVCNGVMDRWKNYDEDLVKFEEIRHHEIQFFFPQNFNKNEKWRYLV